MTKKTPAELAAELPERRACAYIGQRMTVKNRLAHFYQFDGDNAQKGFRKRLSYCPIGARLSVAFDKDGRAISGGDHGPAILYNVGSTDFATASKEDVERWVIEDAAATSAYRHTRMEAKLKTLPTYIEEHAAPLVELVRATRNFDEKAALIRAITDELWRKAR